jgi:hypothetical protein
MYLLTVACFNVEQRREIFWKQSSKLVLKFCYLRAADTAGKNTFRFVFAHEKFHQLMFRVRIHINIQISIFAFSAKCRVRDEAPTSGPRVW